MSRILSSTQYISEIVFSTILLFQFNGVKPKRFLGRMKPDGIKVDSSRCLNSILLSASFGIFNPDSLDNLDPFFVTLCCQSKTSLQVFFHTVLHGLFDEGSACYNASTFLCLNCLFQPLVPLHFDPMSRDLFNCSSHYFLDLRCISLGFFKFRCGNPNCMVRRQVLSCFVKDCTCILIGF